MNVHFSHDRDYTEDEEAVWNILKGTIQYPSSDNSKIEMLAGNIINMLSDGADKLNHAETSIWTVLVDLAICIPPGNPAQDALVKALKLLWQKQGQIAEGKCVEFQQFRTSMSEGWEIHDPLGTAWTKVPARLTPKVKVKYQRWCNINSFAARVTALGFDLSEFGTWEIREALERPVRKGRPMECRLWNATEWLINCAEQIYQHPQSQESIPFNREKWRATIRSVPLSQNLGVRPARRSVWNSWGARLWELAGIADTLKLSKPMAKRLMQAQACISMISSERRKARIEKVRMETPEETVSQHLHEKSKAEISKQTQTRTQSEATTSTDKPSGRRLRPRKVTRMSMHE